MLGRAASHPGCVTTAISVIVVLALYAFGIALFQILGGLGAAAGAFKRWGEASSTLPGSERGDSLPERRGEMTITLDDPDNIFHLNHNIRIREA